MPISTPTAIPAATPHLYPQPHPHPHPHPHPQPYPPLHPQPHPHPHQQLPSTTAPPPLPLSISPPKHTWPLIIRSPMAARTSGSCNSEIPRAASLISLDALLLFRSLPTLAPAAAKAPAEHVTCKVHNCSSKGINSAHYGVMSKFVMNVLEHVMNVVMCRVRIRCAISIHAVTA